MQELNLNPKLNTAKLNKAAKEAAMKGALSEIEDFYNGYNSPYKKAINEMLKNKGFDHSFTLPDVIASINESLTTEIDRIANAAVAKTFMPLVTKFLTRAPKEIKFSEILKKFIECSTFDASEDDWESYSVTIEKEDGSFLRLLINDGDKDYDLGLFNGSSGRDTGEWHEKTYTIFSLPFRYTSHGQHQTMKISLDGGASLEMPFTKGVLEDDFVSYAAGMVMADTAVTFDVQDFDEDMFPERDCYCD